MKIMCKFFRPVKSICCILLSLMVAFLIVPQTVFASEEKVVRVGYDSNSQFIKESDGHYYGYGVEYLEKIAEYTGWKYKYVKDDSWHDSLEKLRNGSIDLICTAHYTDERAAEFLYSSMPIGYETSILYAKTDSKYFYQDYETMQGSKVGLLEESYSASDFEKYANETEISFEAVYFNKENEMKAALSNGEIDMMVVGSRYATPGLKLVDISGTDPFYCITQFKNQNLINEIDDVLHEIMLDEPSFEGNLRAKYFNHESISSMPLYTKEELNYIKNLGTIKVKLIQDQHPSCYMENGETKGIWAEVIKLLSQKSGINIVLEGGDVENYSQETYKDFMNDGYLLLHTQNALQYMSDLEDTILSNSITNVSVSYVKRKVAFVEDEYVSHIIALTKDLAYLEPMLLEENPDYEIQYFDDAKSCFEALTDKKVGVVIQNTHRASYLMQKPEFSDKLTVVPGVDHGNNVCLVASEEQQMLIDIINKAIHHITYDEINEIVKRELLMSPYPLENSDFFYQNWKWMIVVVLILLFAIIGYGIFTNKLADAKIQRREFEILQKKAREDEITGLYNRSYFYEEAGKLIKESNELFYIISMNICNFKVVNEHYGMSAGDQLLKEIGAQLQKLDVNQRIIFARFMIDNYYMCIPKSEFEKIELPKNFKTFLDDIDVRVVYGVFLAEDKEMPVNVMCDRAIEATRNKNYTYTEYIHFYDDNVRKQAQLEQEVESEMEQALAERQFFIVVQPKYDSITESIVGGETLVRWQHPQKGLVSPGVFINIFERNGFIDPLDHFVWEETCRFQSELKKKGIKTVPISINVSRIHFYGSELRGQFRELIEKYDLEPQDIELEITESLCSEDSGKIFDTIRELQSDGFRIAMDDFGSGYSSLNMLKEMPLDIIKLDLKFLDGEGDKSHVIMKALIEMAHTMDLDVVVEGVELLSQVEFLRQFENCYLQGYYYSKPVPTEVFEEMLCKN